MRARADLRGRTLEVVSLTLDEARTRACFAGGWYLLSARKWFKGPKVQGTKEELEAIERDLESV